MEEERSTAVEVQQDECEDYVVDVTTASSWYKNVSLAGQTSNRRHGALLPSDIISNLFGTASCTARKVMRTSGILQWRSTVSANLQPAGI